MSSQPVRRLRPPSVDAVLVASRARLTVDREPDALRDAARAVVDEERRRLTSGDAGASAASGHGARPRLVWTITPVALIARDGPVSEPSA